MLLENERRMEWRWSGLSVPKRTVAYISPPIRFGLRSKPNIPSVRYGTDLFCGGDMAIRFGSINVRLGRT